MKDLKDFTPRPINPINTTYVYYPHINGIMEGVKFLEKLENYPSGSELWWAVTQSEPKRMYSIKVEYLTENPWYKFTVIEDMNDDHHKRLCDIYSQVMKFTGALKVAIQNSIDEEVDFNQVALVKTMAKEIAQSAKEMEDKIIEDFSYENAA